MPTRMELLKQAGFSDAEIGDWATAERTRMHDAGFSDDEIDGAFGVTRPPKEVPAAYIDRLKGGNVLQRVAGAAGDYARQYFGDEPLGFSPKDQDFLHRLGAAGDIIIPAAKPVDAVMRAVPAGLAAIGAGIGQTVEEAGDAAFGPGPEAKGKAARDFAQLAQIAALVAGANRTGAAPVRAPAAGTAAAPAIVLPRAADFRNAAAAITGTPSSFTTERKLLRLWTEHGIPPAEAAQDATRDRTIAADLASDSDKLPAAYAGDAGTAPAAAMPAAGGKPDAQNAPPGQGDRPALAESLPAAAGEARPAAGPNGPDQLDPEPHGPEPAPLIAESRNVSMYDPPRPPQRPFKFDYRTSPPTTADGRLLADMEGRPLDAALVAGRRMANEGDRPVSATDIKKVLPGLRLLLFEEPTLPATNDQVIGLYKAHNTRKGPQGAVFVKSTLSPDDQNLVLKHEFGHAIDHFARSISRHLTPEEIAELREVYTTVRAGPRKTLARQPEDFGYDRRKVNAELTAEGIRAYLTNPNYLQCS